MGLFDIFLPGDKPEKKHEGRKEGLFALPLKKEQSLAPYREEKEEKKEKRGVFSVFHDVQATKGKPEEAREESPFSEPLEDVFVPSGERGSIYRESKRPSYARPRPEPPPSPDLNPEVFARRLGEMFDLEAMFEDVRSLRETSWFRRAVVDSPHTGEPAEAPLGPIAGGPDVLLQLGRIFQVPTGYLREDTLDEFFDLTTAAFELVKPEDIPGWFQLSWSRDGRPEVNLDYYEVRRTHGMGGFFDIFDPKKKAKKKETLPARIETNLPPGRPDVIHLPGPPAKKERKSKGGLFFWAPEEGESEKEERELKKEEGGAFFWTEPIVESERALPEARRREGALPSENPFVPEGEQGSLYKTPIDPFGSFQEPAVRPREVREGRGESEEGPEIRHEDWKSEAPPEVVRKGKRYYVPATAKGVADRMLELYGPEGIAKMREVILDERETPYWQKMYHEYALTDGTSQTPNIELEHMSVHQGPSELELLSEFFNIPLDYLMSFVYEDPESDEESDEGWQELNDGVLYPLFYDVVPKAWKMLLPDLPGEIVVDHSEDDGCPALVYVEIPPKDFRTTDAKLEELEAAEAEYYNRQGIRSSSDVEDDDGDDVEEEPEEEEDEPPPPPPPKKKKKKS